MMESPRQGPLMLGVASFFGLATMAFGWLFTLLGAKPWTGLLLGGLAMTIISGIVLLAGVWTLEKKYRK